jgi:hypothetical protein
MLRHHAGLLAAIGGLATVLALSPTLAQAAGVGSWTPTNDPGELRELAAAAKLPDGRVLIAGGEGYQGVLTLAELFDPTTNTYTTVAPLHRPRDQATATTLLNGKVLVVGGTAQNVQAVPLASAELYDPATNTWTYTGPMAQARFGQQAALLQDGRVLIMGGTPDAQNQLQECEIFDPKTNRFTVTGSMAVGRRYSNAVTLLTGNVLEAGDDAGAEVYNVSTGTWSATQAQVASIFAMPLALLPDGTVLAAPSVVPNYRGAGQTYDPATNAWTATGPSLGRYYAGVATLKDGSVLIAGGCTYSCSQQSVATAVRYIPSKRLFVNVASMNEGRENQEAVMLNDGRVLMQNGFASPGPAYSEVYTP